MIAIIALLSAASFIAGAVTGNIMLRFSIKQNADDINNDIVNGFKVVHRQFYDKKMIHNYRNHLRGRK